LTEAELLERIAQLLRREIAPAIDAEYPRTQAFMAAVVLQKLGPQLATADAHAAAETADNAALPDDLRGALSQRDAPATVRASIDALAETRDNAALCRLIEVLYASRSALGEAKFAALLGRIRRTLRQSIDRRMVVAG
jgi:hypothetical protein